MVILFGALQGKTLTRSPLHLKLYNQTALPKPVFFMYISVTRIVTSKAMGVIIGFMETDVKGWSCFCLSIRPKALPPNLQTSFE